MKKSILVIALIAAGFLSAANAQVDTRNIGLRFGWGAELSYQHPMSSSNRLELDLGLGGYGFGLDGIYQWVFDLSELASGFNWYVGVGAGLGSYTYKNNTAFNLSGNLQAGIEYNFDIPLQISLDFRPKIYILNGAWFDYTGICLGVRYKF